jgi:hypothetical protein
MLVDGDDVVWMVFFYIELSIRYLITLCENRYACFTII